MDSFELNKILGALLGTVFILFSVNLASNTIFASPAPEKPGYAIAAAEPAEGGGATEAPAGVESVLPLLASADVAAGQVTFKKCQTCHDGTKGGPNKTGPNLWGVVERPIATHEGFSYSAGMKEFSKGGTEKWTFEHLDGFLHAPKNYVKGTAMGFAGLKKTDERANLIAFLHTLSDSPVPLPAAGSADKAAQTGDGAAAPAAGDAAAPAAATPATGGNAAAPAKDATAPATPTPADNGNSAAPAPTTAPAAGGDAATPAAPATGDAATPAKGADGGPATEANKPAAPANGAASEPATPPPATATPEPDAAPKN